jgi:large subunit ribosomal protein L11
MAKKVQAVVKLQIQAGKANPAPPVGTALGPYGLKLQEFCLKFNDATKDRMGEVVPCEVSIYEDRTFDFILKVSPMSDLIKKELGLSKGSSKPNSDKIGKLTIDQVRSIAEKKLPDLNAYSVEEAMETVKGTARSMGVEIVSE